LLLQTRAAANGGIPCFQKESPMLETIVVVLILLWALGMVTSYTIGGLLHLLLLLALVAVLFRIIRGRPVV
jgi:hypothetical protein